MMGIAMFNPSCWTFAIVVLANPTSESKKKL
jgi:hypothetical protein